MRNKVYFDLPLQPSKTLWLFYVLGHLCAAILVAVWPPVYPWLYAVITVWLISAIRCYLSIRSALVVTRLKLDTSGLWSAAGRDWVPFEVVGVPYMTARVVVLEGRQPSFKPCGGATRIRLFLLRDSIVVDRSITNPLRGLQRAIITGRLRRCVRAQLG